MLEIDDPIPIEWGGGYASIPGAMGEEFLYYQQFGSYQGQWIMLSFRPKSDEYLIRKDWYGSCSGCDTWQAQEPKTIGAVRKLAKRYPPFVEVPRETMANLARGGLDRLMQVFPANVRDNYDGSQYSSDINYVDAGREMLMIVRLRENLDITAKDIFFCQNLELKRRALDRYGLARFLEELGAKVIDEAPPNRLLRIKVPGVLVDAYGKLIGFADEVTAPISPRKGLSSTEHLYLDLQDSSTPRRYLLRVPPGTKTVREGIATSFGLRPEEYRPEFES